MSYFQEYPTAPPPPKRRIWDVADIGIVIGITAVVVGVGLWSVAAALVVGGAALISLAALWPKQ